MIRKGDEVLVRFTVSNDEMPNSRYIMVLSGDDCIAILKEAITNVTPRALEVNDIVVYINAISNAKYIIMGIDEDKAWIKHLNFPPSVNVYYTTPIENAGWLIVAECAHEIVTGILHCLKCVVAHDKNDTYIWKLF